MANVLSLSKFHRLISTRFQLYNSLFTSLPFSHIERTGVYLPLFSVSCEEGLEKGLSPKALIESFFAEHFPNLNQKDRQLMLFRFVQYVERQIVLFDALEDASFSEIHNTVGEGTLTDMVNQIASWDWQATPEDDKGTTMVILTAHPTQFYPGSVLAIINDLEEAIAQNDVDTINDLLRQLGKTPFFKQKKPTPLDEAMSLIWYLENVFYYAVGNVVERLRIDFSKHVKCPSRYLKMGFWPGGDRDGNPFVSTDITAKVIGELRSAILRSYLAEIKEVKRKITFKGVDDRVAILQEKIKNELFNQDSSFSYIDKDSFLKELYSIVQELLTEHDGFNVEYVQRLIDKVEVFGFHFATLDIRQDSDTHTRLVEILLGEERANRYQALEDKEKIQFLKNIDSVSLPDKWTDNVCQDTCLLIQKLRKIHQTQGSECCHRYIISQCQSAAHIYELFTLFRWLGWDIETMDVDIVPLFESVEDLRSATNVMETLYKEETYRNHLTFRGQEQTIMVGFSDGTKDGGYLMANWGIFKAKSALTALAEEYGLSVCFFDGRGGPPARGGGKTHRFYASMGKDIAGKEIQLTIQGQTVSSKFGTVEVAQFNLEQLVHAALKSQYSKQTLKATFETQEMEMVEELANLSYQYYKTLREDSDFVPYLDIVSPLRFYGETNIGSRPSKRGGKTSLSSLRAIPFVAAWSQIKQNLTGYYGVGYALQKMEQEGRWAELEALYKRSSYFRALIENCEMSLSKCRFELTAYAKDNYRIAHIWTAVKEEHERSRFYILKLSGQNELMGRTQTDLASVMLREKIVLPLLCIQQYALQNLQTQSSEAERQLLEKLCTRCSFGIINASRNSA